MFGRRKVAMVVAEFLGTAILSFVVLNVSRSTIGIPYFVAFAAGLAIILSAVSMLGALGTGGVQFNPALTIALWTARQVRTVKALVTIGAQMLGGWAAYGLFKYFEHGSVAHGSGVYSSHILVAEAVGTFVFAFAAAGALYQRYHGVAQAAIVGAGYSVGILIASAASQALLNPAVALGTNSWGWNNYVWGPVLGAVIGVNLYALLFAPSARAVAATVTGKKSKK